MHTVRVLENQPLTADTHSLLLEKPQGFVHEPGQFVVVQTLIEGRPVRRSYSLVSAPHEEHLEIVVKAQPHGKVSPVLCSLRAGDELGVLGPFGTFMMPEDRQQLVLIAAGTGVAPFVSYLRALAHEGAERPVTIVSSNRRPEGILYGEELSALGAKVHHTVTRPEARDAWSGPTGRIDADMLERLKIPRDAWFHLCGPTPMVLGVTQALLSLGIPKERIRTEKYGKIAA